jgi:ferredoxin
MLATFFYYKYRIKWGKCLLGTQQSRAFMKKIITQVSIDPGCISCGRCQEIAPAIFQVTECAHVCPRALQHAVLQEHATAIVQAAGDCPVQVIRVHEQKGVKE